MLKYVALLLINTIPFADLGKNIYTGIRISKKPFDWSKFRCGT